MNVEDATGETINASCTLMVKAINKHWPELTEEEKFAAVIRGIALIVKAGFVAHGGKLILPASANNNG